MPKIVDHDAYRNELAARAVEVFRRRGYAGIGMREMAKELGISKSALYHYFASKEALFLACSSKVADITPDRSREPIEALVGIAQEWEAVFPGEMRIMLDYIGERSGDDVRQDEAIRRSIEGFERGLESIASRRNVPQILTAILGFLLLRYIDGQSTPWTELEALLGDIVNREQ